MTDREPAPPWSDHRPPVAWTTWALLPLLLTTALVYWPTHAFDYVGWDDTFYILDNAMVRQGLTWSSIGWAWRDHGIYFMPLSWLSFMADVEWFGLDPGAAHLHNVGLHLVNTVLRFTWLATSTRAPGRSLIAASLFALHPLHVEAVAWISQRKELLATLFGLLTLHSYERYWRELARTRQDPTATRHRRYYLLTLFCFLASLLAKPLWVTLPVLLLLLDGWPHGRLTPGHRWQVVREKIPFFLIAALFAGSTILSFATQSYLLTYDELSLVARLANLVIVQATILLKTLLPFDLGPLYPHPREAFSPALLAISGLVLTAITLIAIAGRRERPFLLMGWLWSLVAYLPVSGLVNGGGLVLWYDHWTCLPHIGLLTALVWTIASWRPATTGRLPAAMVIIGLFAWLANQQTAHWRNAEHLWRRAIAVTTDNHYAYWQLGNHLSHLPGRQEEALAVLDRAHHILPQEPGYQADRGRLLLALGRREEAMAAYDTVLHNPLSFPLTLNQIGIHLLKASFNWAALPFFAKAVAQAGDHRHPEYYHAQFLLGLALLSRGEVEPGKIHLEVGLRGDPRAQSKRCAILQELLDETPSYYPPLAASTLPCPFRRPPLLHPL